MAILKQTPAPGEHRLFFRGDAVTFTLQLNEPLVGKACLRTNIGNAAVRRKEIIEQVEDEMDRNAQDWHDLPMAKVDDYTYDEHNLHPQDALTDTAVAVAFDGSRVRWGAWNQTVARFAQTLAGVTSRHLLLRARVVSPLHINPCFSCRVSAYQYMHSFIGCRCTR